MNLTDYYESLSDAALESNLEMGDGAFTPVAWRQLRDEYQNRHGVEWTEPAARTDGAMDGLQSQGDLLNADQTPVQRRREGSRAAGDWQSIRGIGTWARVAQALVLASGGTVLVVSVNENLLWLAVITFIASAVVFLTWFRKVFLVAEAACPDDLEGLEPRWAILAWLVPLLNLVFPFLVARRIWKALSRNELPSLEPPAYFHFWWGSWVMASLSKKVSPELSLVAGILASFFAAVTIGGFTKAAHRAFQRPQHLE